MEKTVGLIVIGDEVLKGQIHDCNSELIAKEIGPLGLRLKKISVIPDEVDTIANEVGIFSKLFTHVITSGGIGPTHDDVTFESIAKAFNEDTHLNPDLVALVEKYFHIKAADNPADPKLKLARVPRSARILRPADPATGQLPIYPVVCVRNVFILPGVPKLFERGFGLIKDSIRNPDVKYSSCNLYITLDEVSITPALDRIVKKYTGRVQFGSYPDFYHSYYKVRINLESTQNEAVLQEARLDLINEIGADKIVDFDPHAIVNAPQRVHDLAHETSPLGAKVHSAVKVIKEGLQKYGVSRMCLGFNGGKDCTVLLHMLHACLLNEQKNEVLNGGITGETPRPSERITVLYIRTQDPFPEEEQFIGWAETHYGFNLVRKDGRIRACLEELKHSHPHIQAVLMGSRRTDPRCDHLDAMTMTDPEWPQFMRINPLLDWTYSDVWEFLRRLSVPYCKLYNRGYTSLGSVQNTHPNPNLRYTDNHGVVRYHPAYTLHMASSERRGRNLSLCD